MQTARGGPVEFLGDDADRRGSATSCGPRSGIRWGERRRPNRRPARRTSGGPGSPGGCPDVRGAERGRGALGRPPNAGGVRAEHDAPAGPGHSREIANAARRTVLGRVQPRWNGSVSPTPRIRTCVRSPCSVCGVGSALRRGGGFAGRRSISANHRCVSWGRAPSRAAEGWKLTAQSRAAKAARSRSSFSSSFWRIMDPTIFSANDWSSTRAEWDRRLPSPWGSTRSSASITTSWPVSR